MRIFITGGSGTLGRRLVVDRLRRGNEVLALTRSRSKLQASLSIKPSELPGELKIIEGDPTIPGAWQSSINGCDAVVHLAGAGIMDQRWSSAYRTTLRESRIDSTYQVVRAIKQAARRPRALLNASAIGFYGDRDDRLLDEVDEPGEGFLAELCAEWEAQALRAESSCRVVCMRFGMILDHSGGALPKMLRIFRLGLGGRISHGRQYMPWIGWQDVVAMIELFLQRGEIRGPVNVVAPDPITNRAFTGALAATLHRPALCPVPRFALKLVLGGAAEVVLSSQRVVPKVVRSSPFEWISPTIHRGLRTILRDQDRMITTDSNGMVVIDIDAISPGAPLFRRILRQADEAGEHVVMATSMGPEGAREFLVQSRVDCPVIAADGAVIVQREPGMVLHRCEVPPSTQASLLSMIADCGPSLEVTLEDLGSKRRVTMDPSSTQPIQDCIRMRVTGSPEGLEEVLQKIGPGWWQPGHVQVHRDRPGRVEILAGMADRSVAVQWLARRWNVERNHVRAVLRGVRSSGLAQWCGQSIALADADESVRQFCDRTSELKGIDGVAEAVDSFL
ncbi:MAG: TIGR01777 family oxidoreductase [Planctomycetota bacterium]|nr:TIGR01777 family oxidoreductase [Planctomycetota bacterium]